MKVEKTFIEDLLVITPNIYHDERGWFFESYNKKTFEEHGIFYDFVQDNHSFSLNKGTIRGIHFQNEPYSQAKLVRCTKGRVLDVAVDLRTGSKTYLKWFSIELTEKNGKQLLIPRGFGHAYLTLEDDTEFLYKVDNFYHKESDRSIRYDDPNIKISWNYDNPILSDKDKNAPFLKDSDVNYK
ncbi:dTDP-4-dehydrorhamnose 3,5-epimerase [Acholeplasma sp. OttesenSCG-928-E16]|nr:dTDP-4-dehydrorhamnose 3,5-epimerase [Acholeplasma sp. OttesenSCG-928-E16]